MSESSIALFAQFLKQTGAKAICIASWNTDNHEGIYLSELKEAFETLCEFPDDWLVGYAGKNGGDRWTHVIEPFLSITGVTGEHVTFDDAGWEYADQSKTVLIDGRLGFNYMDYEQGLTILKVNEEMDLE